jgi:site-specific recombinase XerC
VFAALTIESESVDPKTPALFRALRNPTADGRLSDNGIYSNVVLDHGRPLKLTDLPLFGPHVMRDTAATNALEHSADIAKVREWLGGT